MLQPTVLILHCCCLIQGLRGSYTLIKLALLIETLGITSFTWMMFACLDYLMRLHSGTVESNHNERDENADDRLIHIELGNRQSFQYLASIGGNKKINNQLRYQSNPVQDSDSISV